ncbi:hypothetical protein FACUT_3666 [Fusarium acutatum]|uniref:DUF6546 domain-containing protein n=1 Tax=Fusarium acutatum TaxID=78861 RepID=A0A8H4JZQ7_9HYPO|nr:hypothetical protein FACUT_3666 [Fusarium acutatum]
MRLRSSGYLRWSYLPQDVRRNILNTIVDQRNPRWPALASVSKEWQSVIGTRNMARLNLRPSCLEDFEQAVVRQRDLNDHLMAKAVQKLLIILGTWSTTSPLTLELNASSASDSEHWFKNFRFNDEHDAPYVRDPVIPMEATHHDWHDPKHGWENGVRAKSPPFSALERLFGPIDLLYYISNSNTVYIPMVNAVTRLMIRRQFRHLLEPSALEYILSRFSRLTDFVYEPWSQEYTSILLGPWDPLTQSALQDYGAFMIPPEFESEFNLPDNTKSIAQTSLRLNEPSVSFFIDAMNFFEACEEAWTWDHLKSLSLTSSLLFRSTKGQKQRIDNLLIAAAKLVLRMPNLTTMVLWNGGTGRACAFMYTRTKHYAHITWRGTRDLEISRQVLEVWEDVAKLHSLELRISHERLRETIRSHGDAIFHLNLPCQVIEPTSLWQIRVEDAQGL